MSDQQAGSVLKPAMSLTAAIAAAWAICFWPARTLNPESGVFWMSIAAICCLVPGWIVVFLANLTVFPNDLSVMVVQTMVRLFSVAGAAVVVRKLWPELGVKDFFGWLIGFYLFALALEVWMLRQSSSSKQNTPSAENEVSPDAG